MRKLQSNRDQWEAAWPYSTMLEFTRDEVRSHGIDRTLRQLEAERGDCLAHIYHVFGFPPPPRPSSSSERLA